MRLPSFLLAGSLVLGGFAAHSPASTPELDPETPEPQKSGPVELPVWEAGEAQESFDIRIWPEEVVLWLEQENIRDMIADPDIPEEEKQALKQILVHQKAWRVSDRSDKQG